MYVVMTVVLRLITIFTDVYTYLHIKLSSKQCSTTIEENEENHSLTDICKNCHTRCNNQSTNKQKLDIPFKSTSFSYIIFALMFISFFLQKFVLPYSNNIYLCFFPIVLFCNVTVNIPLIVCLSRKNNFKNMAAARQRSNLIEWNRTHNQQLEMKCAIENRNSDKVTVNIPLITRENNIENIESSRQRTKSEEESKKSCMYLETNL